jgi:hypothetical protein
MSDQAEPQVPVAEGALAPVAVIAHDEAAALATPKTPPAPRGAPKWETEARERRKDCHQALLEASRRPGGS